MDLDIHAALGSLAESLREIAAVEKVYGEPVEASGYQQRPEEAVLAVTVRVSLVRVSLGEGQADAQENLVKTVSATEWTSSVRRAALPVMNPTTNLELAISRLATNAA